MILRTKISRREKKKKIMRFIFSQASKIRKIHKVANENRLSFSATSIQFFCNRKRRTYWQKYPRYYIILCYIIRREKMELSHKELNFCRSGDQSCTTPEQEFTCAVITIIELKYERSLILG